MRIYSRWRALAPLTLAAGILLLPAAPAAADGAFAVDSAEIGKPGDCKVESWASMASNQDFAAVTSPACVVRLGIPVELGAQVQRFRSSDEWGTTGGLKAKINIIPVENHAFGIGISGGNTWDLATGASAGGFINVPVTFALRDNFRINVNGGWLYDNINNRNYAMWGAGFEWGFVKPFTLIGEVFGLAGTLPEVEAGEPPAPRAIVQPRAQIGLRFTPKDNVDFDLIWGHNITGENAHWVTLGVNLRF
jgi:hypothetical protein